MAKKVEVINPYFNLLSREQKEAVIEDMKENLDLRAEYNQWQFDIDSRYFPDGWDTVFPEEEWLITNVINHKDWQGNFTRFNLSNEGQRRHYFNDVFREENVYFDEELLNSSIKAAKKDINKKAYTNEILDKIKAAGIEVVTDKEEFDRILESEAILQKMSNDDIIRNLAKERDDAIEKKNNINAEKLESFKHDVNSHSSLIKELIKAGNTLLENGFDLRHFSADGFTHNFGFNFNSGKITGVGRSLGDDGTKYYIYSDGENISIGPYTFNYDWKYDSEPRHWLEGLQSFKTQLSENYGLNFDNVGMEEIQKNEDIELKEEAIKENVNISQYQKKFLSNALKETAVDFVSVVYSRENYNKIFGDGVIESPVETIILGSNQFIKLSPGNRNNFMYAIRQTLEKPSIILEKETWDDNSESFKPVHLYGKSFINDNNSEKVVESLIVFKEGNNIAVSLHPKGIDKFVEQIKTTNDIVYLDDEVSRVVAFAITGGDSHVVKENENFLSRVRQVSYSSLGQESYPLINKNYNRENLLSSREFISSKGIEIGKLEITKDNFDLYFNILNKHDDFKNKRNRIASELFNFHVSDENKENMKNWLEEQGYTITGKKATQYMTNDNGLTYGFVHDGKIYLNTEIMNSNTAVHEYTHLWDAYTEKTNPELWNKGLEIFKDSKYWKEVIFDPNYQDIKDDDNLVLSEIHSRISGEIAETALNRIAELDGEKVKLDAIDWNTEVWLYSCDKLLGKDNVVDINDKEKLKYLAEFLITPMKDLFSEKNINTNEELSWNKIEDFFEGNIKPYQASFDTTKSEVLEEGFENEKLEKEETVCRMLMDNLEWSKYKYDGKDTDNDMVAKQVLEEKWSFAEEIAESVVSGKVRSFESAQINLNDKMLNSDLYKNVSEIITEKYPEEIQCFDVKMRNYYHSEGTREICHDIKQSENKKLHENAVNKIAEYLISQNAADKDTILVPAPQHTGNAEYTKEIAKVISEKTGAKIADVLKCEPHKTLYEQKKSKEETELKLYLTQKLPEDKKILFVDNVVSTGKTFNEAESLIPGLKPLIYAASDHVEFEKINGRIYAVDNNEELTTKKMKQSVEKVILQNGNTASSLEHRLTYNLNEKEKESIKQTGLKEAEKLRENRNVKSNVVTKAKGR